MLIYDLNQYLIIEFKRKKSLDESFKCGLQNEIRWR